MTIRTHLWGQTIRKSFFVRSRWLHDIAQFLLFKYHAGVQCAFYILVICKRSTALEVLFSAIKIHRFLQASSFIPRGLPLLKFCSLKGVLYDLLGSHRVQGFYYRFSELETKFDRRSLPSTSQTAYHVSGAMKQCTRFYLLNVKAV